MAHPTLQGLAQTLCIYRDDTARIAAMNSPLGRSQLLVRLVSYLEAKQRTLLHWHDTEEVLVLLDVDGILNSFRPVTE